MDGEGGMKVDEEGMSFVWNASEGELAGVVAALRNDEVESLPLFR